MTRSGRDIRELQAEINKGPFRERLKTKFAREDTQKQEDRVKTKTLDMYENITNGRQALSDNATRIDAEKNPVLWNFNAALISMFHGLRKIEDRLVLLENRLDVVRRAVVEDKDWKG